MKTTEIDPRLFGLWDRAPVYEGGLDLAVGLLVPAQGGGALMQEISGLLLELKSADRPPTEALRLLLNDMTVEMRAQFDFFRDLRSRAERLSGEDADEAAGKLARADVKAATDSMSLIIRTLEKVDVLQRQLARDRDAEDQRQADEPAYDDARKKLEALIEQRAERRAQTLFGEWQRDRAAAAQGARPAAAAADADAAANANAGAGGIATGAGPPPSDP